ncbi:unnamed protein product [Musa acuminata subsp. malaccensis]|uniref:(wild Malaysian banana) hypothetical protein n=1 Tax=Musa acuminata subsp. malaccensis TaxID=214687 RepID=A0A804I4S2_MUSAM|nr:unnamed protein product [Musa acuminata subsp. malaccensis]
MFVHDIFIQNKKIFEIPNKTNASLLHMLCPLKIRNYLKHSSRSIHLSCAQCIRPKKKKTMKVH